MDNNLAIPRNDFALCFSGDAALAAYERSWQSHIGAARRALPSDGVAAQIDHASTGPNHLRVVVGQATERDCHRAGVRLAGWRGADAARREDAGAALRHASAAA